MAAYSDLQSDVEDARKLAARKLGPSAKVSGGRDGWMAVRETESGRTRVGAHNLQTLIWFLEQMPDLQQRAES